MAHIHLPDGTFSIQWIITWWIVAIIILGLCLYWLKKVKKIDNKKITMAAMLTAASFAIFHISIPLFGGVHMNLTPFIGILVGPAMGGIIVLIVNILTAATGHGGWSIIGANVLVNMTEVTVAYSVYKGLGKMNLDTFSKAGIGTIIGLLFGNLAMILIILISGIQGVHLPLTLPSRGKATPTTAQVRPARMPARRNLSAPPTNGCTCRATFLRIRVPVSTAAGPLRRTRP